jgi:hypothetical protein
MTHTPSLHWKLKAISITTLLLHINRVVFTAAMIQIVVFLDVTPYNLAAGYQCLKATCDLAFNLDDGDSMFPRNVSIRLQDTTASQSEAHNVNITSPFSHMCE